MSGKKGSKGFSTFCVLFLMLIALGSDGAENVLMLSVGAQRVVSIPGIQKIAIGDPAVADVKSIGNNQVLVSGHGEGRTTLILWKSSGQRVSYLVTVRRHDPGELLAEIRKQVGEIEGVEVRLFGERVALEGQVYTPQDMERIEQLLALYPNVKSSVKIAPNAKKTAAQNITAVFQKAGLRNVQANVVGSSIFLEGSVESPQDLQKADLMLKALGEKVENLLVVGIKRMILSEVQFVEVRHNSTDRLGIKYPTDISGNVSAATVLSRNVFGPASPTGTLGSNSTGSSAFSVGFQLNSGHGRLLAQPRLVCASGEKAEFVAGGEVPVPLITNNQFSVEYKPYGIILRIRPTADRNGNIQTEIEAEASEIDTSVAVSVGGSTTVPGFRTRKVKTNVTVRHGETIVLSGVFSDDDQKAVSKLPVLGSIPILGELFKNRAFDSTQRELIIFVTPRIVNPESERVQTLMEDAKSRYKQSGDEVGFGIFD